MLSGGGCSTRFLWLGKFDKKINLAAPKTGDLALPV